MPSNDHEYLGFVHDSPVKQIYRQKSAISIGGMMKYPESHVLSNQQPGQSFSNLTNPSNQNSFVNDQHPQFLPTQPPSLSPPFSSTSIPVNGTDALLQQISKRLDALESISQHRRQNELEANEKHVRLTNYVTPELTRILDMMQQQQREMAKIQQQMDEFRRNLDQFKWSMSIADASKSLSSSPSNNVSTTNHDLLVQKILDHSSQEKSSSTFWVCVGLVVLTMVFAIVSLIVGTIALTRSSKETKEKEPIYIPVDVSQMSQGSMSNPFYKQSR